MLHITKNIRNITKDSLSRGKAYKELRDLVDCCDDVIKALDSYSKSQVEKALAGLPTPSAFAYLGQDVGTLTSLLKQVSAKDSNANYSDAGREVRKFQVELMECIKLFG